MQDEHPSDDEVAMTIRIPRSLRDQLKALADKDERSLATTIRRALRRAVQAHKPVMRGEDGNIEQDDAHANDTE